MDTEYSLAFSKFESSKTCIIQLANEKNVIVIFDVTALKNEPKFADFLCQLFEDGDILKVNLLFLGGTFFQDGFRNFRRDHFLFYPLCNFTFYSTFILLISLLMIEYL